MGCRAPEIAEQRRVELVWIYNSEYVMGGRWEEVGTNEFTQLRPNTEENGRQYWVSHHCINCGRSAHKCPLCEQIRCDSDLQFTIMGSFPVVCRICRPEPVTTFAGQTGGGIQLGIEDDPEVQWAFTGKQGPNPKEENG